jgi:putative Holliday junction resolvase
MSKTLGIDFGLKKIGLAITEGHLAQPLGVLKVKGRPDQLLPQINFLCQKEEINQIIIGLPESGLVVMIKEFGKNLSKLTHLPVVYQPETLTTQEAIVKMKQAGLRKKNRKKKEDAIAAALILQSWLDQKDYV